MMCSFVHLAFAGQAKAINKLVEINKIEDFFTVPHHIRVSREPRRPPNPPLVNEIFPQM